MIVASLIERGKPLFSIIFEALQLAHPGLTAGRLADYPANEMQVNV